MLESIFAHLASDRIQAFSAGSNPAGTVNPYAIQLLQREGHDVTEFRSKSWDEFSDNPEMDIVITVCGNAKNETCPIWPGVPVSAHWGVDDPADPHIPEESRPQAFDAAYFALLFRAKALLDLEFETLSSKALKSELDKIGSL